MGRFVEYFCILGAENQTVIDHVEYVTELSCGLLHRFPNEDRSDYACPDNLELFAFPNGVSISNEPRSPKLFTTVLTSVSGDHNYLAFLTFDELFVQDDANKKNIFVSKAICTVSRNSFYEQFKLSLVEIYRSFFGNVYGRNINNIVISLLNTPNDISCGVKPFCIRLSTKLTLDVRPPLFSNVPSTGECVYKLARQLGIVNLIKIFKAALLDHQILFVSSSHEFLREATTGLAALLYPFNYIYVFIPDLPYKLAHVLNIPTPFIIGVHSSITTFLELSDDLVEVNLDIGFVTIPSDIQLPVLPKNLETYLKYELSKCLFGDINIDDSILTVIKPLDPIVIDKKIRSIFLLVMAMMLNGFSSSIIYLRVHPISIVKFEENQFHEKMRSNQDQFLSKLTKSSLFNQFVSRRGVTYRQKDFFDELLARNQDVTDGKLEQEHLEYATKLLMDNEYVNMPNRRISMEHKEVISKTNSSSTLSTGDLEPDYINSNIKSIVTGFVFERSDHPMADTKEQLVYLRERKISRNPEFSMLAINKDIIKMAIGLLFDGKIAILRQVLPKLYKLAQGDAAIYLICMELKKYSKKRSLELTIDQFSIVSEILNICFKLRLSRTSFIIASSVMNLSCKFFTLVNGHKRVYIAAVMHTVYQSLDKNFWMKFYYERVASKMCKMYSSNKIGLPEEYSELLKKMQLLSNTEEIGSESSKDLVNFIHPFELLPLKLPLLIANEIERSKFYTEEEINARISNENKVVRELADKFVDKIIKCNFNINEALKLKNEVSADANTSNDNFQNFMDLEKVKAFLDNLRVFINKFVESISSTVNITYEYIPTMKLKVNDSLVAYIKSVEPSFVNVLSKNSQLSSQFCRTNINLLQGEIILYKIEAFILPNGIRFQFHSEENSNHFIPAYGTVHLTNYKFSFIGCSMSSYMNQIPVTITLPYGIIKNIKILNSSFVPKVYSKAISINVAIQIKCKIGPSYIVGIPDSLSGEKVDDFVRVIRFRNNEIIEVVQKMVNLADVDMDADSNRLSKNDDDSLSDRTLASNSITEVCTDLNFSKNKYLSLKRIKKSSSGSIHVGNKNNTLSLLFHNSNKVVESSDRDSSTSRACIRNIYLTDFERLCVPLNKNSSSDDPFNLISLPNAIRDVWKSGALFGVFSTLTDVQLVKLSKDFKNKRFPVLCWVRTKTNALNETNKVAIFRSSEVIKPFSVGKISKRYSKKKSSAMSELDSFFNSMYFCYCKSNLSNQSTEERNKLSVNSNDVHLFRMVEDSSELYDELEETHCFQKFYIFAYNAMSKNVYSESSFCTPNFEFHDTSQIRIAYNKIMRINSFVRNKNRTYYEIMSNFAQSNWLKFLAELLETSSVVTFLTNICNSFCHIGHGDGTEETSQVTSLVQIMSDSYYRTCKGFIVLIDKEWLASKHRFLYRNGIINNNQNGFAPYFLQFMDCVHQLLIQFPWAFQFNDFFLKFICYYSLSNRFVNFLIGYESKMSNSVVHNDGKNSSTADLKSVNSDATNFLKNEMSHNTLYADLFPSFILHIEESSTLFYNAQYVPDMNEVIYPSFHISSMEIWDFYFADENMQSEIYEIVKLENIYKDFKGNARENKFVSSSKLDPVSNGKLSQYIDAVSFYDYRVRRSTRNDCITKLIDDRVNEGADYIQLLLKIKVAPSSPEIPSVASTFVTTESYKYGNSCIGNIHRCYVNKESLMKIVSKNKFARSSENKEYFKSVSHCMSDVILTSEMTCTECDKVIPIKSSCTRCKNCSAVFHIKCSKSINPLCNFDGKEFEKYYEQGFNLGSARNDSQRSVKSQFRVLRGNSITSKFIGQSNISSSTFNMSQDVVKSGETKCSGYLSLKGSSYLKGKKRFYILDHTLNRLYKFKNEANYSGKNLSKANFIDLKTLVACDIVKNSSGKILDEDASVNDQTTLYSFELKFRQGNTRIFTPETISEGYKWVSSFKKLLNS